MIRKGKCTHIYGPRIIFLCVTLCIALFRAACTPVQGHGVCKVFLRLPVWAVPRHIQGCICAMSNQVYLNVRVLSRIVSGAPGICTSTSNRGCALVQTTRRAIHVGDVRCQKGHLAVEFQCTMPLFAWSVTHVLRATRRWRLHRHAV